jgi:4-hydroxy-tetrahydrodipicolinate reductase
MSPLKIAVAGASGRMGRTLIEAVLGASDMVLVAAFERAGDPWLQEDAGVFVGRPCGVSVTADIDAGLAQADCLIDFTRPDGTMEHLVACLRCGKSMVIGTTGLSPTHKLAVQAAAEKIPLVLAPNMSVGVNVVFRLLDVAARVLDPGFDVEIIEAHHRHKVDAPSGTALRMGEIVASALGRNLGDCAVYERHGVTGERAPESIGFATVRGGDIVGDHTVLFAGSGERVEISHKSGSRMPYAEGSLRAARFLAQHRKGLFDMQDVLGLR